MKIRLPLLALIGLPLAVYAVSYAYLAVYHGEAVLFNTIIHEGGLYTFLQTLLYASHFLGHIPVHTVLAMYFVGVYLCLSPRFSDARMNASRWPLLFLLASFLIGCVALSFAGFGKEDTLAYILQQKQNVRHFTQGGSWNLHLPSTLLQFALIPIFIFEIRMLFALPLSANRRGLALAGAGVALCVALTVMVNDNPWQALLFALSDPRHLAHSVREIATFPLIYYPLPLYFFLKWEREHPAMPGKISRSAALVLALCAVIFAGVFLYQLVVPLSQGVGSLAQKPAFMRGESLSLAYLLASHYFEHFLDTIFFVLACLILFVFSATFSVSQKEGKSTRQWDEINL